MERTKPIRVWNRFIDDFEFFCLQNSVNANLMPAKGFDSFYYVISGDCRNVELVVNYLSSLYEEFSHYDENIIEYVGY